MRLLLDSLAVLDMAFDRLLLPPGYPVSDHFSVDAPCKQASIHGHVEDNHVNDAQPDLLADVAGHHIRASAGLGGAHEGADDDHEGEGDGRLIENLQGVVLAILEGTEGEEPEEQEI